MKHRILAGAVLSLTIALPSGAEELRGETFCFPADKAVKIVEELAEVEDDRRDVVNVGLEPRFIIKDEGVWPERFYLSKDDALIADLPFSRETGAVPSFMESIKIRPDTDICIDDPTRADRPQYDEGLYFEMGLSPIFHNRSGTHDIAEMEEGAKDGKKFYKKMIPPAFRMFMPDTDYMAVKYEDTETQPDLYAITASGEVPLTPEAHKDIWIVSLDDMEEIEATALIVRGGPYDLQPVPSPKVMRQFGWGQESETGQKEDVK